MSENINILGVSDQLEIQVIIMTKHDWCIYKNIIVFYFYASFGYD